MIVGSTVPCVRARLLVIFSGICFGTTGTAQALGPEDATSISIGAARIALGALMLVIAAAGRGRGTPAPGMARWWWIAGTGMALFQLTFFAGVRATGVVLGTVIALGSAPALTGFFGWVLTRERPSRIWAIATSITVVGVLLLASGADEVDPVGALLALGAGASYAAFAVASKQLLNAGVGNEYAMAKIFTIGAIMLSPLLFTTDTSWIATPRGLGMLFWLAAVPTMIAYLAYAAGLKKIKPHEASTLTLAEPVTATLLGAIVLAERPSLIAWTGAGIILFGLIFLARAQESRSESMPHQHE
jgi:drug/metabolite transporter, DME family